MEYIKLYDQYINNKIPNSFKELADIAFKFDTPDEFVVSLNWNELGYDTSNIFLGERFLRLNRGYTLDDVDGYGDYDLNDSVTIYRTGNTPII